MDQIAEKIGKDIEREIDKKQKLEEKLRACNERIKQLQQKKAEAEDSQMLASIKEFDVSLSELQELLRTVKGKDKSTQKEEDALKEGKAV